jgi:hypothetical protein
MPICNHERPEPALPRPCAHGHIVGTLGTKSGWRCDDCQADWTTWMMESFRLAAEFDKTHPIEVSGPDGRLAQYTQEEWDAS